MTESIRDGIVNSEVLSAAHINALSSCLSAIEGIFETFLALDVTSTRCLPVFNFVRVAYAVVILLKMYFSASSADSELGRVIRKEDMRVHYYLDAMLEKFRATAADDKCRPAAKFLVVLAMFRSWFFKQESQPGGPDAERPSSRDRNAHSQALRPQPQPPHANTPLHLLSEVAAGSKSSPSPLTGTSLFAQLSGVRQPPQPFFHQETAAAASSGDASTSGSTPGSSNPHLANAAPPSSAAPLLPAQNASGRSDVDLGAAMAPAFPPWVAQGLPPDFFITGGSNFAHVAGDGTPGNGGPLGGLALSPDTQNAFEGGARFVMNEPWFTDVFSGMPDPNLFPF
jgi:RalA-binding protein 1